MSLQALLGEIPKQKFVADYLHRRPFSLPGTAADLCSMGTWDLLGELLAADDLDVMVVRDGVRSPHPEPKDLQEARELSENGQTLVVRHAERHHPRLQELAGSFREDFQSPINVHVYVTPAGSHGFSWHYDAEDVFIIQTAGIKHYSLRQNTVHPWPLVETIPADMRFERESMPLMQAELRAGDWLYIPCGYWHKAEAPAGTQAAISLAVGVLSWSALDVFDFLRTRLLDSIRWRQRLPTTGAASPLTDEELEADYRAIFAQLADDLNSQLTSEYLAGLFREWIQDSAAAKAESGKR